MFLRSTAGRVHRSDTDDGGRSWSAARPTDLSDNNSDLFPSSAAGESGYSTGVAIFPVFREIVIMEEGAILIGRNASR
jgi:hypothetical protein